MLSLSGIKNSICWMNNITRVVIVVTAGLYFALRFIKDPGFVPYDAIFFTDQDQGPMNR